MATLLTTPRQGFNGYAQKARWATVRIETEGAVYVGRLFVPETKKRLSDVLCDDRPFLNMTEVTINDSSFVEPFVALNKSFVKSVRVIHEDAAEGMPIGRGR
jgi:hypothetical protein